MRISLAPWAICASLVLPRPVSSARIFLISASNAVSAPALASRLSVSCARLCRRQRQPTRSAEIENDLGDRAIVLAEEVPCEPFSQKAGDFGSALFRSWLHNQVDVDLELAGADRHLDAVTIAACVCERLRDSGLGRPEEVEDGSPT